MAINRELRYIVISDVHLGHRNNTTREIIKNLDLFFDNYKPRTDGLNLIVIAGDLFDTLLDLTGDQIHEIVIWMSRLMRYCVFNKVALRILEGTPSHDWMQSALFDTIEAIVKYQDIDYKYVKTLSIEIIEKWNCSVLYVPDEWHNDPLVTFAQIKDLLAQNHLQCVDIAIMHGQFTYQLPAAAIKAPRHNETAYLEIVKHFINIGHVHQFSTFERILAQGSFDRLCHGDEIPKGGLYMVIRPNGHDEFFFLENKSAKIFKTINLPVKAFDDLYGYLDKRIEQYPRQSFIRLKTKEKEALNAVMDQLRIRYAQYHLSKDTASSDASLSQVMRLELDMTTYSPIVIRVENIEELLLQQITQKYSPDQYNAKILHDELIGVL